MVTPASSFPSSSSFLTANNTCLEFYTSAARYSSTAAR
ncbi:hypothetical protein OIU77_030044 [Salix suchowensis]|uniref:Uncharacterized protein n=1 Tax=Salix suchowensis TaxID=1278906 RepID=A0ABQ9BE44_9ROSI|nr:hypothetical protein OIU77_030044 [Salix suchowensis]